MQDQSHAISSSPDNLVEKIQASKQDKAGDKTLATYETRWLLSTLLFLPSRIPS